MTPHCPLHATRTRWRPLSFFSVACLMLTSCTTASEPKMMSLPLSGAQCVTVQMGDDGTCVSAKKWTKTAEAHCGAANLAVTDLTTSGDCAKNRYTTATITCCDDAPAQCEAKYAGSSGACRTEAQWTAYANYRCEAEARTLTESAPVWACDGGFRYIRFTCCADEEPLGTCDDDAPAVCAAIPPSCGDDTILSSQNGCYSCVDPWTCAPPCGENLIWDVGLGTCCPNDPVVSECDCNSSQKPVTVESVDSVGCLVESGCDCVPCEAGDDCFDACASAPCLNSGSCTSVDGEATCDCPEGFAGTFCDTCAEGYSPDGDDCIPCPTCLGSPWPDWTLEDIEPSSTGYQDTYGLTALPSSVTVVTLLVGW